MAAFLKVDAGRLEFGPVSVPQVLALRKEAGDAHMLGEQGCANAAFAAAQDAYGKGERH